MEHGHQGHGDMNARMLRHHYLMLGLNLLISLIIMYFVMFTMIYSLREFVNNLNMFYMALMMAAPMVILMLLMMGDMYANKRLNLLLYVGFLCSSSRSSCGPRRWLATVSSSDR